MDWINQRTYSFRYVSQAKKLFCNCKNNNCADNHDLLFCYFNIRISFRYFVRKVSSGQESLVVVVDGCVEFVTAFQGSH